jgi:hypothetical protein
MSRSPVTRAADPDSRKTTPRAAFMRSRNTTTRCTSVRECRLRLSEANCTFPVLPHCRSQRRGPVMRCQHVDDDIQCRLDATRRVLVGGGDPPTQTSRDSRGRSTSSRSARSTIPIPGGRCRCRALLRQRPSGNVRDCSLRPAGPRPPSVPVGSWGPAATRGTRCPSASATRPRRRRGGPGRRRR